MKFLIPFMLAAALCGCAGTPTHTVKTVVVKVPVATKMVAPDVLLACGHKEPAFKFSPGAQPDEIVIAPKDQPAFQAWIEDKNRCIDAWRAWAQ